MRDFDPDTVSIPNGHFIAGTLVTGGQDRIEVRRPSDNRRYADLPVASGERVDEAVQGAAAAFQRTDWGRCAPRERARILRRWADLIEADAPELGRLEALGSTRPVGQVGAGDIAMAAESIRFFAEYADKLGGDIVATRSDNLGMVVSEPYGVVAAIAPWNFPIVMAAWKVGPALAAGNAVVLKPSELTPFSAVRLAQLALQAGVPAGIFNVVQGTGAITGDALCRHPTVGKISFTGSTRTGSAIMIASAEAGVKPVTLELGGKSPQLVFADAPDLDATAAHVARGILGNAGQVCVAGTRLIVQHHVRDALVDRLLGLFSKVVPGPTWAERTSFPPLISVAQADRVDAIVRRGVAAGAEALTGGGRMTSIQDGAFYEPTILAGVTSDNPAVREEIFGPVLTVQSFQDDDEGFALADHPVYGLASGVHTGDLRRAMRAVREIKAGTVWVNRYGRSLDYAIPTGGFKGSGIGKDLGRHAVEAHLRHKSVLIDFAG